jgi:hypothetical protein
MREILGPSLRAAAITAFIGGLALLILNPPSFAGLGGLLTIIAGTIAIVLCTAWLIVLMTGRDRGGAQGGAEDLPHRPKARATPFGVRQGA